jgi:hypothetical protein
MVNGTLVFEKLHSVPVEFMAEEDHTGPKEDPTLAEDGKHKQRTMRWIQDGIVICGHLIIAVGA